ncbi:MAG: hypothetical protein M3O70_22690, partial [Actinomycetota bacterium]|nr:hypothetical protein [Actinomycetota bacterium]
STIPEPTISDSMWPQSNIDEVREAQERADAGDPNYTWQVDPRLAFERVHLNQPAIVERFLREQLGWDQFLYNPYQADVYEFTGGDPPASGLGGLVYLRCAPGETNPLYPVPGQGDARGAERCAPTIDDLRYESVTIDLAQFAEWGPDGVWVVWRWAMNAPFEQADPRVAETEVTAQLEELLAARIAGDGAEGYVKVDGERGASLLDEVPLLYATTSGAPYERFEIERVSGPRWPYAEMEFKVRLFADDGATVVEQPIAWAHVGDRRREFLSNVTLTTENGQPVAVPYAFFDGQVTASAAHPWELSYHPGYFDAGLTLNDSHREERVALVPDPLPIAPGCEAGPAPADAAALAQTIRSDSNFEATAPVEVIVGGAEGLHMDVTLVPGASVCPEDGFSFVLTSTLPDHPDGGHWGTRVDHGSRMRLYLVDLPEGSATRILAIAVVAPEARFEDVVEAAAPVVDSIEFHAP